MKKLILVILFLFSVLSLKLNVYSNVEDQTVIGTIVKMRGKIVRINRALKKKEFIKVGSKIFEYDVIGSGEDSFVKILMRDDTIFQLGPKSKFVFSKFNYTTKKKRTAVYNLLIGKLRSIISHVTEGREDLKIKTPNTAMAIRGTEVLSDVYKYKGQYKTDIALISGELEVELINQAPRVGAFDKKIINLRPGYMFETSAEPSVFDAKKDKKIKARHFRLKKLPEKIMRSLRNPNKKGGNIFLYDARKSL